MSEPSSPVSPFPTGASPVPKAVLRVRRSSRELDANAIEHSEAQHWVRRMSKELLEPASPSTTLHYPLPSLRCGRWGPRELLDLRRADSAQVSRAHSPTRTEPIERPSSVSTAHAPYNQSLLKPTASI